jgi:AcrR family transcriptional regulator
VAPVEPPTRTGLPASIEAAWGVAKDAARGPRPRLSRDLIVEAGIRLADAEGLSAVSMARVAAALGAAPMSLYRYVGAKEELLTLMVDKALAPPASPGEEGWRAALERWAWAYHARLRAHPWVLQLPISGPPTTPNQIAYLEQGLRALAGTGLAEDQKASVVLLLSGYVRSAATLTADLESGFLAAAGTRNAAMSGYAGLLRELADRERFPALHAVLDAGVFDAADDPDAEFRFGLERLLDGVGHLVG